MKQLEDKSQDFKSKTLSQLLRGAPDLRQHIKNLREQFEEPSKDSKEKGGRSVKSGVNSPDRGNPDDLLLPQDGKDEAYDNVEAEIATLKDRLDAALKKLAAKSGFVVKLLLRIGTDRANRRAKLDYWSSSQGNKDIYQVQTSTSHKGKLPSDWVKSGGTKVNCPNCALGWRI